jgi:hypothetical protein
LPEGETWGGKTRASEHHDPSRLGFALRQFGAEIARDGLRSERHAAQRDADAEHGRQDPAERLAENPGGPIPRSRLESTSRPSATIPLPRMTSKLRLRLC